MAILQPRWHAVGWKVTLHKIAEFVKFLRSPEREVRYAEILHGSLYNLDRDGKPGYKSAIHGKSSNRFAWMQYKEEETASNPIICFKSQPFGFNIQKEPYRSNFRAIWSRRGELRPLHLYCTLGFEDRPKAGLQSREPGVQEILRDIHGSICT